MNRCGRCGKKKVAVSLLPYPNDVPIDRQHGQTYYLCEDCMYVIFKNVVTSYEAVKMNENNRKEWWCKQ